MGRKTIFEAAPYLSIFPKLWLLKWALRKGLNCTE